MPKHKTLLAAALLLAPLFPRPASALEPKEVAVLYNATNAQSLSLAQYYMHARHIPRQNLIPIRCPGTEWITESEYRQTVVPWVRKGLEERKLTSTIKCLVTVRGLPLVVGPVQQNAATRDEIAQYQKELQQTLEALNAQISTYNSLGGPPATTAPANAPPATLPAKDAQSIDRYPELVKRLNQAEGAAARRINSLDPAQRGPAMEQMVKLHLQVAGIQGVLTAFQIRDQTPGSNAAYERRNAWQSALRQFEHRIAALSKNHDTPKSRQELVDLQTRARGLLGRVAELQACIHYLSPEETESCFDSELALVLAKQDYPRYRWLLNPRDIENYPIVRRLPNVPKPLLVSRLDGVSNEEVIKMIDTSLRVEKNGLDGKIYLDARGLHGNDAYAAFDADIRRAADWLRTNSTMPVVLDDTGALLEAKNCPDAALYCGWYSLHSYHDSCQWLPGSVAYHVASLEMPTLHNPNDTGWVPNLLKHDVCGTLGAVAEPYLTAFPKPSQFFPLLLCGEFTQGEVWEVTNPMVSWRIGYVGDPLYNPFKVKPRVKVAVLKEDSVLRNAWKILRPAVSTQPATVP